MGVRGVRPPDLPYYVKTSQPSANHHADLCSLFHISTRIYLNLIVVFNGKGGGSGLSPDPWFHSTTYDHVICNIADRLVCTRDLKLNPWSYKRVPYDLECGG
jgi:hypothetical protein